MQTPTIHTPDARPRIVSSKPIPNLPNHLAVVIEHAGRRFTAVIQETDESIINSVIKGAQ